MVPSVTFSLEGTLVGPVTFYVKEYVKLRGRRKMLYNGRNKHPLHRYLARKAARWYSM
jgi:hypothetical protein